MVMDVWRPRVFRPRSLSREIDEMERLLEQRSSGWPLRIMWRRIPTGEMAWAPSIEMYEREDGFILRAELPGVSSQDIDISMVGDALTIKGERRPPEEVKEEEYQCSEMCYGSFSRSITMPTSVDASKVEATYQNGVLELRLPKAEQAKPSKIEIKTE
jgi:HSP20 family protein